MGTKLMNCCKREPMGTKGWKMVESQERTGGMKDKQEEHKKRVSEASEQV